MKRNRFIPTVITILILVLNIVPVSADIAPPFQPPGANPGLPEFVETSVEMGFETVMIEVEESSTLYYRDPPFDTVNAHVTALFSMSNKTDVEETLQVLFPLNTINGWGDKDSSYPEIQDFTVSINDFAVDFNVITDPNPQGSDKPEIKWAEFEVIFPPKEIVFIEVGYDLQSTGWFPEATFNYILETGKGWHGPIGEANIRLILPYEASSDNVLFGGYADTSPGGEFDGNEVHWKYLNLEPETEDNWSATIIAPHIWDEILDLRESAAQGDGSAYKKLTIIYDGLYIGHGPRPGTEGLMIKNHEAYQKALEFDPDDDDVLARFADFRLTLNEMGLDFDENPFIIEDIYSLASQALEINPDNEIAPRVINALEKSPHNFTPAPTTSPSQQTDVKEVEVQTVEPEPTGEPVPIKTERNQFPFSLLAGGLVVSFAAIIGLAFFIGKRSAGK